LKSERESRGEVERASKASPPDRIDSEVVAKPKRRRFTAEYKLSVVREADACRGPGEIGALLRREGLYSSHLAVWRRAVAEGSRGALVARRRGPKAKLVDPLATRIGELERENERLLKRLDDAETIIAVQKKLAEILRPTGGGRENSERRR
jgi:transposase-like protein